MVNNWFISMLPVIRSTFCCFISCSKKSHWGIDWHTLAMAMCSYLGWISETTHYSVLKGCVSIWKITCISIHIFFSWRPFLSLSLPFNSRKYSTTAVKFAYLHIHNKTYLCFYTSCDSQEKIHLKMGKKKKVFILMMLALGWSFCLLISFYYPLYQA